MTIFIISSELFTVFAWFGLACAIGCGEAVQNIFPVIMWIIGILNITVAIVFFILCRKHNEDGLYTIVSAFSSIIALTTTYFVLRDLYYSIDESIIGIFFFILELILVGLAWLSMIFGWLGTNFCIFTDEEDEKFDIWKYFIYETAVGGILIALLK